MTSPDHGGRVRRSRLEDRLETSDLPRLTALVAGPGSGKTTLLAQTFNDRTSVWHTLTPADRSLTVLARNVVRKLRLVAPQISSELVAAVEGARGPDVSIDSGRPMAIAAALAHDLDLALTRDVVLVLDDVHELTPGTDSANFLAALCRHVPSRLRFVTSSRAPLPFPVARMQVAGEYLEITTTDLAFTINEIADLITLRVGRDDPELAKEIVELTGGWPVASVLAVEASTHTKTTLAAGVVEEGALFDYLAEEVLASEDPANLQRLRQAMVLPWFDADLLHHLGIEEGAVLAQGSVYVNEAPDVPGARTVAPLVAEFLRVRGETGTPVDDLLSLAVPWFVANGSLPEALTCLMRTGDEDQIAEFVGAHGDQMVAAGHTHQIIDAVDQLGGAMVTIEVALIDAEARQLLGDWEGAQERYRNLVPKDGAIGPGLAWRAGFLRHMQGRVVEALELYERGERGTGADRDEASLLGWEASAHWLRGERDQAKTLADDAIELARRIDDPRALATAHTVLALVAAFDGDRAANDLHYLKALEHADRGRDVVQTIRIRSNRASAFLEEGEFDSALAELDIALRLADMTGFELWRGMALSNRGQVYAYRGRLEEAVADLNESRMAFRRIGSLLESYPVVHLGEVYRSRGDTARARVAYEEALTMAEEQDDRQVLVPAWTGLSRLLAVRDPMAARRLAQKATETDSGIGRAAALVAEGVAADEAGERASARGLASEAAAVARSRRDLPGLGEALELLARVDEDQAAAHLDEAAGVWEQLDVPIASARVELARAGMIGGREGSARARRAAETALRHGAAGLAREARVVEASLLRRREQRHVVIKTLGGFEVIVAGQATSRSAWQSRVAREVLWMLVSARGRPLNREVLIDRLWPEDDLTKASNRLSVALSTIRKVLNPTGDEDAEHIVSDRDAVSLDLNSLSVDVELFLAEASEGRALLASGEHDQGLDLLSSAEERYVGEFLEEAPYAEWAISLREQARSEYLAVASLLAEASEGARDFDGAARRYLRMLERDPYSEPAHLGLVVAMRHSGRHGTARRLYGNYVARMAELDIEPEPFPDSDRGSTHS